MWGAFALTFFRQKWQCFYVWYVWNFNVTTSLVLNNWALAVLIQIAECFLIFHDVSRLVTKQTNWLCAEGRLRSALASAQSDQSLLSTWRSTGSLATHWAHSKGSDQTGRMPRLIWVFAGRTVILLVLSWGGSCILSTLDINTLQCRKRAHLSTIQPHDCIWWYN